MKACCMRVLPLVAAILLSACQTVQTTQGGAVGVERKQAMMLSSSEVNQAAAQSYAKTMEQARAKGILNTDRAATERVRRIATRLIPSTATFRADAPGWQWETNVIDSKELNAWCMPGGKMAVYTGLIQRLKLSDDEIAAVMGHEMAHALREHGRERASRAMMTGLGVQILSAATGIGQGGQDLVSTIANVTFMLPNSREHETEADRMGVEIAARSGYDPRAAVTLWRKMAEASGGGQPPQFLSTHPSHATRLADLEQYAARVMPLYEQTRRR